MRIPRAQTKHADAHGRLPGNQNAGGVNDDVAKGVKRSQIDALAGLGFIERNGNVVLVGPSGVGKTHLAIALGYRATQAGTKHALQQPLACCRPGVRRMRQAMMHRAIKAYRFLIIDEVGYPLLPCTYGHSLGTR